MKKVVGLIFFIVVIIVIGKKGMTVLQKYRHAKRLKIEVSKFKLINLSSSIQSNIILSISNFSTTKFIVDQVNIDIVTISGEIIAKQITPLSSPISILPNQNTNLPLNYKINTPVLLSEIKKIGGVSSVIANFLTSGKNGLPVKLAGFIVSGSFEKSINTAITV